MRFHICEDNWTILGNVNEESHGLAFNKNNGLLYSVSGNRILSINPLNANLISNWIIYGLSNSIPGDLVFSENNILYLCTISGLYSLELNSNNNYQASRISGEDLSFTPSGMALGSNEELWVSTKGSNSNLVVMDKQTAGWFYQYGSLATNAITFDKCINDLSSYTISLSEESKIDTDNDGIPDIDDSYPNDATKAFEIFTLSKYRMGTLAFEDLWPYLGDYDFNDVAVNYKITTILNASNMATQIDFQLEVSCSGASFINAFDIELENILPSQIASVSGQVLQQNYINLNTNGTEQAQENAVIILYGNNLAMLHKPFSVSIVFTNPIVTEVLGLAPYNPFIIRNSKRKHEIHLPNKPTTSLAKSNIDVDGVNHDSDGNYKTDSGLPWAINIIHDFKLPTEKTPINKAYNLFNQWATSLWRYIIFRIGTKTILAIETRNFYKSKSRTLFLDFFLIDSCKQKHSYKKKHP
ncbi:MAG: LruC domain-containing protein [Cellulophaga sp.]